MKDSLFAAARARIKKALSTGGNALAASNEKLADAYHGIGRIINLISVATESGTSETDKRSAIRELMEKLTTLLQILHLGAESEAAAADKGAKGGKAPAKDTKGQKKGEASAPSAAGDAAKSYALETTAEAAGKKDTRRLRSITLISELWTRTARACLDLKELKHAQACCAAAIEQVPDKSDLREALGSLTKKWWGLAEFLWGQVSLLVSWPRPVQA